MYRIKLLERKNMNMKNFYVLIIYIYRFKVLLYSDFFIGFYFLNWFRIVILVYM